MYQSNFPVDKIIRPSTKSNYFKALENDQKKAETGGDLTLIKDSHNGEIRVNIVLTLKVLPSALSMGAAPTPVENYSPLDLWTQSM